MRLEIRSVGLRRGLRGLQEQLACDVGFRREEERDRLRVELRVVEAEIERLREVEVPFEALVALGRRLGLSPDGARLLELLVAWEWLEDREGCLAELAPGSRGRRLQEHHVAAWLDEGRIPTGREVALLESTHPLSSSGVLWRERRRISLAPAVLPWLAGVRPAGLELLWPGARGRGLGRLAGPMARALEAPWSVPPVLHLRGIPRDVAFGCLGRCLRGRPVAAVQINDFPTHEIAHAVFISWFHDASLVVELVAGLEGGVSVNPAVLGFQVEARRRGVPLVFVSPPGQLVHLPLLPHAVTLHAGSGPAPGNTSRKGLQAEPAADPPSFARASDRPRRRRLGVRSSMPVRGPALEDLVLPPTLREQVEELCFAAREGAARLAALEVGPASWGKAVVALFSGPPGTGKTLLAAALAHHLGRPLVSRTPGQLLDKYVGESEKQVEALFVEAREAGAVLFLDEVDAMLAARGGHALQRHDDRLVNQLLLLIEAHEGLVLMATNRADILDEAVRRRVMFELVFRNPGPEEVEALWRLHLRHPDLPLAPDIDWAGLARKYPLRGGHVLQASRKAVLRATLRGTLIDQRLLEDLAEAECRRAGTGSRATPGFRRGA